jgi:hypothetical protein
MKKSNVQTVGSISVSVLDTNFGPGRKMRLVVSITAPPGWTLVSQDGNEFVYEGSGFGNGATNFEIRAATAES